MDDTTLRVQGDIIIFAIMRSCTTCMIAHTHCHYCRYIPWMGSALQRILSAITVTHHISSCWMSLLQEGAGSVEIHQSTKTLWRSLGGYWLSISSRFESGTHRQIHSNFHSTSFTASVTASGVSATPTIRENR